MIFEVAKLGLRELLARKRTAMLWSDGLLSR